ncbi:uncharacterized protein LOC120435677, partial [Oreochromis aureus]
TASALLLWVEPFLPLPVPQLQAIILAVFRSSAHNESSPDCLLTSSVPGLVIPNPAIASLLDSGQLLLNPFQTNCHSHLPASLPTCIGLSTRLDLASPPPPANPRLRTLPPSVSLLYMTSSSPVTCHATGFYPHKIMMFWKKDGVEIHEHVDKGDIFHNYDGTFQSSVNMNVLSVPAEDWMSYSCVFQFSVVEDNIVTQLNKSAIRTNWGKIENRTYNIDQLLN